MFWFSRPRDSDGPIWISYSFIQLEKWEWTPTSSIWNPEWVFVLWLRFAPGKSVKIAQCDVLFHIWSLWLNWRTDRSAAILPIYIASLSKSILRNHLICTALHGRVLPQPWFSPCMLFLSCACMHSRASATASLLQ